MTPSRVHTLPIVRAVLWASLDRKPVDAPTRPKLPKPTTENDLRPALAAASPKLRAMITLGTHAGPRAAAMHHVTYPPANSAIQRLVKLGFLEGVTGRSYGRMYACPRLMRAVEQELPKSDDYSRR